MMVKLMSEQDMPDTHPGKRFSIYDRVKSVHMMPPNPAGGASPAPRDCMAIMLDNGDSHMVELGANVYLMNDQGKTIASYGPGTRQA